MVHLACLLVIVPLVAGGMMDNQWQQQMQQQMMQQQMMQQMMQQQMMQQQGGWGWGWGGKQEKDHDDNGQQNGAWWGMDSKEDYEAYLKWCQEKQAAMQEQKQQEELLKMWEQKEEERKMAAERARIEHEAAERREMMSQQMRMWQAKIEQQGEFDDMMYKFQESKHKYMYMVTSEFLKFCKCTDFSEDLERYFMHDGVTYSHNEDWELDDLEGIDTTDPVAVAQALANRPKVDQVKAFFGGLAYDLCGAAAEYVEQVRSWEKQYDFLDKLL